MPGRYIWIIPYFFCVFVCFWFCFCFCFVFTLFFVFVCLFYACYWLWPLKDTVELQYVRCHKWIYKCSTFLSSNIVIMFHLILPLLNLKHVKWIVLWVWVIFKIHFQCTFKFHTNLHYMYSLQLYTRRTDFMLMVGYYAIAELESLLIKQAWFTTSQ